MLFSPCINRIYVFLKCCSIAHIVPSSVPDVWRGNNAGVTGKEPWFWRPDVAAEAALCPYRACGVSPPRSHQLKKSDRFFRGSQRKKPGLAAVTPSTQTRLQMLARGLSVKQHRGTTSSESRPSAQPGRWLCPLRGTAGFQRPRASLFITPDIRRHSATRILRYWRIGAADSRCFAPWLRTLWAHRAFHAHPRPRRCVVPGIPAPSLTGTTSALSGLLLAAVVGMVGTQPAPRAAREPPKPRPKPDSLPRLLSVTPASAVWKRKKRGFSF